MVRPTTGAPVSCSKAAAAELSTPPLMAMTVKPEATADSSLRRAPPKFWAEEGTRDSARNVALSRSGETRDSVRNDAFWFAPSKLGRDASFEASLTGSLMRLPLSKMRLRCDVPQPQKE